MIHFLTKAIVHPSLVMHTFCFILSTCLYFIFDCSQCYYYLRKLNDYRQEVLGRVTHISFLSTGYVCDSLPLIDSRSSLLCTLYLLSLSLYYSYYHHVLSGKFTCSMKISPRSTRESYYFFVSFQRKQFGSTQQTFVSLTSPWTMSFLSHLLSQG